MRPETIKELIAIIVWSVLAVSSSIAVKLQWVNHTTFFSVLGCSSGLLTAFFGVRHYFRVRPYIREVVPSGWTQDAEISSQRSVRVTIPATDHRKGKFPKVEFLRFSGLHSNIALDYEISKDGDVTIYHREDSFIPPWKEFVVRITSS